MALHSLRSQSCNVDFIDLYARQFNPVLTRDEFPSFNGVFFKPQREQWNATKNGTLPEEVQADLDLLLRSDLLVLSFPLWWFSMPAILKGWLDRVFAMGAVAGGDLGTYDNAALTGRRAVVLTSTGGPAEAFTDSGAFGNIDDFLFHINRGILEFVGYDALEPIVTYGPAHIDDARRTSALAHVGHAFDTLCERPLASTSRRHL